jgi:hypothetical protein
LMTTSWQRGSRAGMAETDAVSAGRGRFRLTNDPRP